MIDIKKFLDESVKILTTDKCANFYGIALVTILSIVYWLYYRKYRHYIFLQKEIINDSSRKSKPRGLCPPFFPNGWYRIMNSDELSKNESKYINYCGREIVVFRTDDGKVHALHAYCVHMGANLGVGGKVKGNCIECPFHGWTFDGHTGDCVVSSKNMSQKAVVKYEYNNGIKESCSVDGSYLKKCDEGNTKLKRYLVRELNNSIMVWYDSRDEYQEKCLYEPLNIDDMNLDSRGESINFVNCHVQEIPENGADIRHFDFLHTNVFEGVSFIQFDWTMLSHRATDPDLYTKMKHKLDYINEYKTRILKKYLTDENKQHINVISLDCYVRVFKWRFFMFNATGFQVGPGLVYLFLKSPLFELIFAQSITPLDKFLIRVSHKIYTSSYLPYGVTAYMLFSEVKQVMNDMKIWNNKLFGSKLTYNMKTEADKNLHEWRSWFHQFYENCYEYEKGLDKLNW